MRYQEYFKGFAFFLVWFISVIISCNSAKAQPRRVEINCSAQLWKASFDSVMSQIGTTEKTGNNDGEQIDNYLRPVGLRRVAYCYAGQYWGFYVAAGNNKSKVPLLNSALASAAFNYSKINGWLSPIVHPQPLDLIFWKFSRTPFGHAARIIAVNRAGWIETIEFNTTSGNTGNQRDGGGVWRRKRNIRYPLGRMGLLGFIGRKK